MPYNTTAIPPRKDVTGQAQLPLARVKKIIALDSDIAMCSNNAAFVITVATEMFIQYLAEQGHNVVKSERKPRRNIQYRDLASAVSRMDTLEFLSDIVPRTVPYKQIKEKKARDQARDQARDSQANGDAIEPGQTTLDGKKPPTNGTNGFGEDGMDNEHDDEGAADPNAQLEMEIRGARASTEPVERRNGDTGNEDVDMS